MHNASAARMLNDRTRPEIFVGLFWSHGRISRRLKVCVHISPARKAPSAAHAPASPTPFPRFGKHGRGHLPLTLGQGDTTVKVGEAGQGGRERRGREKKNPSPPLAPCPAPAKMNQNWKTTCKVCLIQEHLQYADVFFCTLCLLNCL